MHRPSGFSITFESGDVAMIEEGGQHHLINHRELLEPFGEWGGRLTALVIGSVENHHLGSGVQQVVEAVACLAHSRIGR